MRYGWQPVGGDLPAMVAASQSILTFKKLAARWLVAGMRSGEQWTLL
jgi:hypothetical protein